MISHIPEPQPDQILPSIAALASMRNGLSVPSATAKRLFGIANPKDLQRPFHRGSGHLYKVLGGLGYRSSTDFIDKHGYIGLFRAFAYPAVYQQARTILLKGNLGTLAHLLGIHKVSPFADQLMYCQKCASHEFESLGFAYAHRTPQVVGVTACPIHNTCLGRFDSAEWSAAQSMGLLVANPDSLVFREDTRSRSTLGEHGAASARFGIWVQAAFAGTISIVPPYVRQRLIEDRLNELQSGLGLASSSPERLEALIASTYTEGYLARLGLGSTDPFPHWPALLISSQQFDDHTMANLLVLSALFDSPASYNERFADFERTAVPTIAPAKKAPIKTSSTIKLSLLKDLLRVDSLEMIASKNWLSIPRVRRYLEENPGLRKRRPISLLRINRRRHRSELIRAIDAMPAITRAEFRQLNEQSYYWLLENDRTWLHEQIAPKFRRHTKNQAILAEISRNGDDKRIALALREATQRWLNGSIPIRVTKGRLLEQIDRSLKGPLANGMLPETMETLDSLIETEQEFVDRAIRRLKQLVERGEAVAANQWATPLLQRFRYRQDLTASIQVSLGELDRSVCALA